MGGAGLGCSFQITASSPSTPWAARTGSASRSGCDIRAWVPGSGSRTVTGASSVPPIRAVGAGANPLGSTGRATVAASPRMVRVPPSAKRSMLRSSRRPSTGRAVPATGVTPSSSCIVRAPSCSWVLRSGPIPAASRLGVVGPNIGGAITATPGDATAFVSCAMKRAAAAAPPVSGGTVEPSGAT